MMASWVLYVDVIEIKILLGQLERRKKGINSGQRRRDGFPK